MLRNKFFFWWWPGSNPGLCVYYALSISNELSSRERMLRNNLKINNNYFKRKNKKIKRKREKMKTA
jgi:hypothetical protein